MTTTEHNTTQTRRALPWWLYAVMAATWPLLLLAFTIHGWVGNVLMVLVLVINAAALLAFGYRSTSPHLWAAVATDATHAPWPYLGLGLIGLASVAAMPLPYFLDWPRWYLLLAGLAAGVLTIAMTLWIDHRLTTALARPPRSLPDSH